VSLEAGRLANDLLAVSREEFPSRFRRGVVTSRDPAAKTCSVQLGGDTTTTIAGVGVLSTAYVPIVGDNVWVALYGPAPLVLGSEASELPKAKMRSTATQTITTVNVAEKFDFNASGGTTSYDTDVDQNLATMVDRTNSRIYVHWPGVYAYGYSGVVSAGGSSSNRFFDVKGSGTTFLPPRSRMVTADTWGVAASDERFFTLGEYIELWITSAQNSVFGSATDELGMCLWMSYKP